MSFDLTPFILSVGFSICYRYEFFEDFLTLKFIMRILLTILRRMNKLDLVIRRKGNAKIKFYQAQRILLNLTFRSYGGNYFVMMLQGLMMV